MKECLRVLISTMNLYLCYNIQLFWENYSIKMPGICRGSKKKRCKMIQNFTQCITHLVKKKLAAEICGFAWYEHFSFAAHNSFQCFTAHLQKPCARLPWQKQHEIQNRRNILTIDFCLFSLNVSMLTLFIKNKIDRKEDFLLQSTQFCNNIC